MKSRNSDEVVRHAPKKQINIQKTVFLGIITPDKMYSQIATVKGVSVFKRETIDKGILV
jgi:hypothetical protein